MEEAKIRDLLQQTVELMSAGRFEVAKSLAQDILKVDKRNFDAYIHLGNACVNLEQLDEGIEAFKKALLLQSDSREALFSLGCAYFLKEDTVNAVKQFNRCEEKGFATPEMYGLMQAIFVDMKDYTQALRCANKAIQLNPLNARPYLDKAQIHLMQGKREEAVACLREVEGLLPDAGDPYLIEAQIYEQAEEYEQALAVIDRAISRFPLDGSMRLAQVRILNSQGKYKEALSRIASMREKLTFGDGIARELALQESIAHAGLKNLDGAAAALEVVIEDNPQDADALYLFLNESYALKQYDKVERCSNQLLAIGEIEPRYRAAAIFMGASALKELGREEDAALAYRKAVRTLRQINIGNPGLMEVYAYRALSHTELGEYEEAHSLADHLVNMAPDNPAGYAFKYGVYVAQGNAKMAEQMKAKVHELDPSAVL